MENGDGTSDSTENSKLSSNYDLEDVLVYKLANRLGGRSEVMELSLLDALAYLIIVLEEEKQEIEARKWDLYLNHLSRLNSKPPQDKEDLKQMREFIEQIDPLSVSIKKKEPVKKQEWNFEQLETLKELQY